MNLPVIIATLDFSDMGAAILKIMKVGVSDIVKSQAGTGNDVTQFRNGSHFLDVIIPTFRQICCLLCCKHNIPFIKNV